MLLVAQEVIDALLYQWKHETENRNIYLFISSFLANKGMNNLAKKFRKQADEEATHASLIFDYVTNMGGDFIPKDVPGFDESISSILDIARIYRERETKTTISLQDILDLSIDIKDSVSETFLRKMIEFQTHEYEEVSEFEDKANVVGENWQFVLFWDLGM